MNAATVINGTRAYIDGGGPMRKISVNGRIYEFEMHWYCGPTILNRKGDPLKHQPLDFLHAASLWAQQGERVDDNGLCVWEHEAKPILKHLGGRHYKIIGHEPPQPGA